MRILHVISSVGAAGGGPPVIAVKLAEAQAEQGATVGVLAYAPLPGDFSIVESMKRQAAIAEKAGHKPVRLHMVAHPGNGLEPLTARRARAAAREVVADYDFAHVHAIWEPILGATASVFAEAGKPYAVCPHGMLDPWSLSQRTLKKRIALKLWVRSMLDGAAFLHMGNKDEMTLVGPLKLKAKFEQIPNGVSLKEFADLPAPGTFYDSLPALAGKRYILFMSRLHYKKGLRLLACAFTAAAPSLPDVHLVVAGPDGGEQAPFVEMIKAAGLSDRVHLTGPIYGTRKLAALVDAACFCLPSSQEGFSVAITEALAIGTPVVVTKACHYPEVSEYDLGVETELTTESVAAGMKSTLARTDRAAISARAKSLIAERFNWPMVATQTLKLYAAALQGAGLGVK